MQLDMKKADQMMAALLAMLGFAVFTGGYQMDRLEIRQIHPASIPGLVPMILGGLLVLCALLLFLQTSTTPDNAESAAPLFKEERGALRTLLICMVWSVFFAVILVGNMPFAVASGIYITVFYALFTKERPLRSLSKRELVLLAAQSVALGAIASTAIASLFRYAFLVRLP